MLELHIKGTAALTVTDEVTAAAVGSGMLPVFATPSMIALMEKAAAESVAPQLDAGMTTVGTKLDVAHTAATPVGMTVRAETELTEIDGRRLVFTVRAFDELGEIGSGTHERFIVNAEKFLAKAEIKLKK
ncbi:MAG: thioesterase [Clostridiales bacterium]|nr:MAG: thioesterase [Clostridiales bacterium]